MLKTVARCFVSHITAQELAVYLSHDHADALFEQCGLMPVVKDAVDDSKLQILQDIYEGSVSLPKLIETENIWENLNMLLTSVWEGEDIERAKSKLNVAVYVALSTRTEQEDR